MPRRIPNEELARLKREVSLERLVEAAGVKLKRQGKDLVGLCPFHADKRPSLSIDPVENHFHCFGCGAHGTVIDWVMKMNGVSMFHALQLLRQDTEALVASSPKRPMKRSTVRRLTPAVERTASDFKLLEDIGGFYHRSLLNTPRAMNYLAARGLSSPEMIEHFQIGFVNRTLGLTVPEGNREAGAELRARLKALRILKPTGHEYFRGCFTLPLRDEGGQTVSFYGRRLDPDSSAPDSKHLYMPGEHQVVFNVAALKACEEVILTESPFDALTFWAAGIRNVISSYGTNGFTKLHREALIRHQTRRVLIAYDNDHAGNPAAEKLAGELGQLGIECFRIRLPHGMDVNEYAAKVKPAAKTLAIAVRSAEWTGSGPAPERSLSPGGPMPASPLASPIAAPAAGAPPAAIVLAASPEPAAATAAAAPVSTADSPAPCAPAPGDAPAVAARVAASPAAPISVEPNTPEAPIAPPASVAPVASPTPEHAARMPATAASSVEAVLEGEDVYITRGPRRYRVRGLFMNKRFGALRVNLLAQGEAGFHIDTLDLMQARSRVAFEKAAAIELGCPEDAVHADMGVLLMKLEELQEEARKRALLAASKSAPPMSADEQAAAIELLRDPELVTRILADFTRAGVVGEITNKLVGYLGSVSRKLEHPLALIVQSTSAAGKSTLMDAILDFVPKEEREQFSAMTGQALFYMGQTSLAHKVLAVVEEEGAERASYALKLLQSEGKLSIASTGKDPTTGRLITHEYDVEGPVMIFLTTTALEIDDELLNRCIVLTVDEEREQTRAIHERQRLRHTIEGRMASTDRGQILSLHQNAQRLLAPVTVSNPFAMRLTFLDDKTRTRRDHEKYLSLIDAITLLHQHQRAPVTTEHQGELVSFIESTLEDIELANGLADEVLGRSLDELPPQTRRLLELLDAFVIAQCKKFGCARSEYFFTRRQVREATGWGNSQLKLHMARLADLEYVIAHRSGAGLTFVYELVYDGRGADGRRFLPGLIDVKQLAAELGYEYKPKWSGLFANRPGQTENRPAPGRPLAGAWPGGGRVVENAENGHQERENEESTSKEAENTVPPLFGKLLPYRRIPPPGRSVFGPGSMGGQHHAGSADAAGAENAGDDQGDGAGIGRRARSSRTPQGSSARAAARKVR